MLQRQNSERLRLAGHFNLATPTVRSKGTRNKLLAKFVATLHVDFEEHGVKAIQDMQVERPNDYVQGAAA